MRLWCPVALALLLVPLVVEAHQTGRVYRVGVLETVPSAANLAALRRGLAELGYVEGQNLAIEHRSADGRTTRLADLAHELVRLNVDAIVTQGTPAALAAKQATTTVPIVMGSSGDPAAEGVVASFARPGGNVTGFHVMAPPEMGGKRLRLLKEMVPALSRVAVLWNSGNLYVALLVRDTETVARAMGVKLQTVGFRSRWNFDAAFEEAILGQTDAVIAVEDDQTLSDRARVVEFATMSRLPAIYGLREFAEAGGLMAYGTDRRDLFRRAAGYVHRILEGTKPGDLPIEPPTRFELVINLKTARALRLTVPPSLLQRADHVIE